MTRTKRGGWGFVLGLYVYTFIPTFGGLLRVGELLGSPVLIPANPRALADPVPIALHILASLVFGVLGPLQLRSGLRQRGGQQHRQSGYVFVAAGLVAALTGLWMTHFYAFSPSLQGPLLYWVRITVSLGMLAFLLMGVFYARDGQIARHAGAMVCAYALGQGAATQTVLGLAWTATRSSALTGFDRDVMMASSWGLNLLIALGVSVWIGKQRRLWRTRRHI
ncbi:MAG: DUF2306 domain-containing protein [Pseudomonadota bacterium]